MLIVKALSEMCLCVCMCVFVCVCMYVSMSVCVCVFACVCTGCYYNTQSGNTTCHYAARGGNVNLMLQIFKNQAPETINDQNAVRTTATAMHRYVLICTSTLLCTTATTMHHYVLICAAMNCYVLLCTTAAMHSAPMYMYVH